MNKLKIVFGATLASLMLASTAVSAAEPAAPAAATAPVDRMQETVCRRDKETGSLVKSKKTCHTRAQWQYIDDTNQAFSRDMVDTMRTKPGGN